MNTPPSPFFSRGGLFLTAGILALVTTSSFADTKLITAQSPLRYLVPTDGSLGGTWRNTNFNDASWTAGQNGIGYEVTPGAFNASVIADSRGDFSAGGRQGENSWINGYYNKTIDPDSIYQASDFQPFPRSDGPWGVDNFWDGSAWNWFNGDPPWDFLASTDIHPNSENNGGEHWVIRRWSSTATGPVTLRFHVRKTNLNGTGVTGKVFKNGVELFTQTIAGNSQTGFEVYVNTTAAIGDLFDFALTPLGLGGDATDGADGSVLTATILSGTIVPPPPPVGPMAVADSSTDWSGTGVQGANNWFYGYYNKTADANGVYDPATDFNRTDPNWAFSGGSWQLGETGNPGANPPWDTIGQTSWHPNGDNQPQGIHYVIRRWVSEVAGEIYARVRFSKDNVNGNGTTLHVYRNGVEVFMHTLAGNGAPIEATVSFPVVAVGDLIDFALDPKGSDGSSNDGSDSSSLTASIFTGPPPQATLANSVADWVTGAQGENGWNYGFYDMTADPDHVYNPGTDFNTTDPNWTFTGGAWQLGVTGDPLANPPWDTIGQTDWHPNGDNQPQGVHWVIKRWVSDVDGDMTAHVEFGKQNVNGGNGTTLRVLHNGVQRASYTVGGTDGTGINTNVAVPGVFIGDAIEFALDPLGTDGTHADGADGSFLRATILAGLPPEPPAPFVPGIADCFSTDVEAAMKGTNSSIFIRYPFNVANPASIQSLRLKIKYNDGFAAYLNGKEVVKRNAPTAIAGTTFADSIADWSTNPDMTVNGWAYGYYDQSLDADGAYSGGADFRSFPHDGGGASPTDFWVGNGYDWFNGNPPWTELFQEGTHPAAPNGAVVDPANPATHVQWSIRRWNATVDANLKARVRFRKTNPNCGDGVRVSLFHNSVQVYSQTIASNDTIGRDDTVDLPDVFLGDTVDLLLGPGDAGNDGCDGSAFSVVIFEGEPSVPWDAVATASRTTTETISPEVFDLTSFISELTAGPNVLAIQGINDGKADDNFLVNTELLANQAPTAVNDSVMAAQDTAVDFPASTLLANDSDPDGDRLLVVGVTPTYLTTMGGTIRLFGANAHYTPPAGFTGMDSFQYTIADLSGIPVRALVSVNVTAAPQANRAPSFTLAGTNVTEGTTAPRTIANWVTNISPGPDPIDVGQSVSFGVSNNQANLFTAQPVITPNGTLSFTAKAGAVGVSTVTVLAIDNGGTANGGVDRSAPQTFTITVNVPLVICPTALAQSVSVDQGGSVAITLTASNAAGATYAIGTAPAHGTLSGAPPSVTYTPASGYCGTDSFTFTVTSAGCAASTATVSIAISCENECPVARASIVPPYLVRPGGTNFAVISPNNVEATTMFDGSLSSDPDGDTLHYAWFEEPNSGGGTAVPPGKKKSSKKNNPPPAGDDCVFGKVSELSLQYTGYVTNSHVVVVQRNGDIIFDGPVQPGGVFRFQGTGPNHEMGPEIAVLANGRISGSIVTSGKQPVGPGLEIEDFRVVDGLGNMSGDLCPLIPPPLTNRVQFGNAVVAERSLFLGVHFITLEVYDGQCTNKAHLAVEVITAGKATEECIDLINSLNLDRKITRPLIDLLKKAGAEFDKGKFDKGSDKLEQFIEKVEREKKLHPAIKETLMQCAQQILYSVN